jgi:hypothetical protein
LFIASPPPSSGSYYGQQISNYSNDQPSYATKNQSPYKQEIGGSRSLYVSNASSGAQSGRQALNNYSNTYAEQTPSRVILIKNVSPLLLLFSDNHFYLILVA